MAGLYRSIVCAAFAFALLSSLAFAAQCEDACKADFDKWEAIEKAKYDAGSYYCGVSSTNCGSRVTVPAGQSDPCWSMCYETPFDDAGFQSCCYASAQINDKDTYDKCMAACAPANASSPPSANQSQGNASTTYNVEITQSGSVIITDLSGNPVTKLGKYPVSMKTGADGNIYLVFKTPSGEKSLQLHLLPGSDFRIDTSTCPVVPAQSGSLSPAAHSGRAAYLSSEHGCIRGTINGGGDFIQGPISRIMSFSGAGARRAKLLTPFKSYGGIEVNDSSPAAWSEFELAISLPDGNVFVNSSAGGAAYKAEPEDYGVTITVYSGSVVVTSDKQPGVATTLNAGEFAAVRASTTPIKQVKNTTSCIESSDCPGVEVCQGGECVKPSCSSAFVLAALAGAAFLSRR